VEQSPNISTRRHTQQQISRRTGRWKSWQTRLSAGSDYVFPRMANIIIKDILAAQDGVLTGERYYAGLADMDAL